MTRHTRCRCAELGEECARCRYRISRAEDARNEPADDTREMDWHYPLELAPRSPW